MEDKTGGPAFPTENAHQSGHHTWHYEGLSAHDYFVAKAIQGLLANSKITGLAKIGSSGFARFIVESAAEIADAALEARK